MPRDWYRSLENLVVASTSDSPLLLGFIEDASVLDPADTVVSVLNVAPVGGVIRRPGAAAVFMFRSTNTDVDSFDVVMRVYREARAPEHVHFGYVSGTPYREVRATVTASDSWLLRFPATDMAAGWSTFDVRATAFEGGLRRGFGTSVFAINNAFTVVSGVLLPEPSAGTPTLFAAPVTTPPAIPFSFGSEIAAPEVAVSANPGYMLDPGPVH